MSHQTSKQRWDKLSGKEQELLWFEFHGSRLVPNNLSGTDLDNFFKKLDQKSTTYGNSSKSLGGDIPA